jgi:hypothetical protein
MPGDHQKMLYGQTSYYSGKAIFHSKDGQIIVATLPTASKEVIKDPKKQDFKNIDLIFRNLEKLRCHMYDDGVIPVALVNKLVSLANHPSQVLLEKFTSSSVKAAVGKD